MSSAPQAQNPTAPLDPIAVKIALVQRGWSQARLAKEIGKSPVSVNLSINHGSYPQVVELIRKTLNLP